MTEQKSNEITFTRFTHEKAPDEAVSHRLPQFIGAYNDGINMVPYFFKMQGENISKLDGILHDMNNRTARDKEYSVVFIKRDEIGFSPSTTKPHTAKDKDLLPQENEILVQLGVPTPRGIDIALPEQTFRAFSAFTADLRKKIIDKEIPVFINTTDSHEKIERSFVSETIKKPLAYKVS